MKLTSLAAAGFFIAALPTSAFALEAQEFADALAGMFAQADFHVSFDSVTMQGNDVILDGVTAAPGEARPKQFDLKIVFKSVGETDDGGFTAERAVVDRFIFEQDEVRVRLDGLVWENVLFYAQPPADGLVKIYQPSRFFTGPLRVFMEGEEVFRVASMTSDSLADETNGTVAYSFAANGISLDLTRLAANEDAPPEIADFGLTVLNAQIGAQSQWNVREGRMQVTNTFIDIGEIGRASFAAEILGYDETFLAELNALQQNAGGAGDLSEEERVNQLMNMANALFLNGATLRFDDDGITNKLLDLAAAEQGIPRAVMTIGFAAALPIMASELGVSETLQTAILRAATDYMISPRSFEIKLEPNKPVRFSRLSEAIESEDVEALLGMFNLVVTANED